MQVIIFRRNDDKLPTGSAKDECTGPCDLRECFPDYENDEEYRLAHYYLNRDGRYWGGGGAIPIFLIRKAV